MEELIRLVDEQLQRVMRSSLQELNMSSSQVQILSEQKKELKRMLRKCGTGDRTAKCYVKQTIRDIITEQIQITQEEMDRLMPVRDAGSMSERDMFEVMLCCHARKEGSKALERWMVENALEESRNDDGGYEITAAQVRSIFCSGYYRISDNEQLELLVQRVYADYRGLGVVDDIRDMDIDGVSGGVSGMGEQEDSVWIMFRGKTFHLSFLSFGSSLMLQRICRRIYRYGHPGQLSEMTGYIVNEMADHARVVVARPDFSENWVFFVRKLDNLEYRKLEHLYQDEGCEIVVFLLKLLVRGVRTIAVTGAQGSGKTTLLMALIAYIPGCHTLRIQESAFELQLRRLYPGRNIVSFRETASVSAQAGLDLQKKTDGTISIVGEVANDAQASLMLQTGQMASLCTLFTHHANSTGSLIHALQNSLLKTGSFTDENAAQRQVVEVVQFHVHLQKDADGKRSIEYISEIVPLSRMNEKGELYGERVLVRKQDGRYILCGVVTDMSIKAMEAYLTEEERRYFNGKMLSYLKKDDDSSKYGGTVRETDAEILSTGWTKG